MSKATSGTISQARSARFLMGTRPKKWASEPWGKGPKTGQRLRPILLKNLLRLAELANLFDGNCSFLSYPTQIKSVSDIDQLIFEFLKELNDHHFPVNTDYRSDDETWEHPAIQGWIPLKPKGFSNWYYDEPITLFMALAGLEEDPDPALDMLATDYPWIEVPWGFKLSHLAPVLARTPLDGNLKFLPDLIRMVTRRTGSFLLDHSPFEYEFYSDRGGSIYWSKENVDWLKADWGRAKPIHKRVWQLIDWTMAAEQERTTVLMDLVLEAHEVINP